MWKRQEMFGLLSMTSTRSSALSTVTNIRISDQQDSYSQPVETFEEQEDGEQGHEFGRKVVAKDSESQTSLCHRVPGPFYQMFHFNGSQLTEEHLSGQLPGQ